MEFEFDGRFSDNVDADLIIMGTHGRHGIRRAFLGSVTERVLRETQRPVMTVTPKAELVASETEEKIVLAGCATPVPIRFGAHQASAPIVAISNPQLCGW